MKKKRKAQPAHDPRTGVKAAVCPSCGMKMDAATSVTGGGEHIPRPGDYSVCLQCGQILIFDEEREPVLALPEDLEHAEKTSPENFKLLMKASAIAKEMAKSGLPLKDRRPPEPKPIRHIATVEFAEVPGVGRCPVIRTDGPADLAFALVLMCRTMMKIPPSVFGERGDAIIEACRVLSEVLNPHGRKFPEVEIYRGKGGSV